jgi:hypothetical protein
VLGGNAICTTLGYILYQCFLSEFDTPSLVVAVLLPNLIFLLKRDFRAGIGFARLYRVVLLYATVTMLYWYAFWSFLRATSAQIAIVILTLSILVIPAALALLGYLVGANAAHAHGLRFRIGRLSGAKSLLALLVLSAMLVIGVILMKLDVSFAELFLMKRANWIDGGTAGLLACVVAMSMQEVIKAHYGVQATEGRIKDQYTLASGAKQAPSKAHIVMMAQILGVGVSLSVTVIVWSFSFQKTGAYNLWSLPLNRLWLLAPLFVMGFVGNAYFQIVVAHFQDAQHGNLTPFAIAPWLALRPMLLVAGTTLLACLMPTVCASAACGKLPNQTFWLGSLIAIVFFIILMAPFYSKTNGFSGSR